MLQKCRMQGAPRQKHVDNHVYAFENDEICVIKKRHSVPDYVFAERLNIAMAAKMAQWNNLRRSSLMSAKDRLKQAFEFSLVASYTRHLIAERPWSSGRKVLEERHGTLRTSFSGALALSSAVPGSLDLGTPPIEPPSGER